MKSGNLKRLPHFEIKKTPKRDLHFTDFHFSTVAKLFVGITSFRCGDLSGKSAAMVLVNVKLTTERDCNFLLSVTEKPM